MKKAYKKELKNSKLDEVRIIDPETGYFKSYHTNKEFGFPFGIPMETTVFEMGYSSVKECLKALKDRNYLGKEVNYKEQMEQDRIGYLNLGVERIKRAGRINTRDFEDVVNKLADYGMNFVDAQNVIVGNYLHQQEFKEVL